MADEKNVEQTPLASGNPPEGTGEGKIDLDAQLVEQLSAMSGEQSSAPSNASTPASTSADPFERLSKKKVAKPQPMGGAVSGQVKKGSKISPKMFLVGCGIFFLVFLGSVYAALFYAISSSDFLQTIGLEIEDVKLILKIFALLFFGIIFFGGFYVLVLNVYRLVTVKNKSKAKYIAGLVLGFVVIISAIIFGTLSITRINSLAATSKIQTNLLVLPFLVTRDGFEWAGQPGVPFIAPMKVKYQLNKDQFDRNILPAIGGANSVIATLALDCGNGQKLLGAPNMHLDANGGYFADHCLYITK